MKSLFISLNRSRRAAAYSASLVRSVSPSVWRSDDEPRTAEGHATFGRCQGTNAALGEVGFGRGLMEAATLCEFGERVRLERETVLGCPVAAGIGTQQDSGIAIGDDQVAELPCG